MLNTSYLGFEFAKVTNLSNFYKNNLPEMPKVRGLMDNIKIQFSLPQTCIDVYVAEGERVYKFVLLDPSVQKLPIGFFVYLPLERRLDAFVSENPYSPYIQWKNKKIVYKGYPIFLERAGVGDVFGKLTNIL